MLTLNQKLKILQSLICLISVNAVYSSGVQLNKEGNEKLVFVTFEAELAFFSEQRGRWASITEFKKGEFTLDSIRATTKNNFVTGEKIWEKGMASRRELVSWRADYGKILNFTVLKPLTDSDEKADKALFDLELNEDSGGNADLKLLKILQKVRSPLDIYPVAAQTFVAVSKSSIQKLNYYYFHFRFMMTLWYWKRKPAIVVEGGVALTDVETPVAVAVAQGEIPAGFFTFGFIAMKYLVVKAYKG